jgi:hypothetical protein
MTMTKEGFEKQFSYESAYYHDKLDIIDWLRYFAILNIIMKVKPARTLEIGPGMGILKKLLPGISTYSCMDVNGALSPDFIGDVRMENKELSGRFECVVAAQVLEHIPFGDVAVACKNLAGYLAPGGMLIITVPHRRSNFLFMSPDNILRVFTVPTGFLSFGAFYRRFIKRKIWIDPDHCWEIGDGTVTREGLEAVLAKAGLSRARFEKIFYSDLWVLEKASGQETM